MKQLLTSAFLLFALSFRVAAQEIDWKNFDPKKATPEEWKRVSAIMDRNLSSLDKTTGEHREIRSWIMRGNKITTIVYNYGNITRPNTLGNVADLVWNRLGYGFEFTPLVAAEVQDSTGATVHIVNDGMYLSTQGGYSPDGTLKWGWLPKAGYAYPDQADIAAWSQRSDVKGDLTKRPHAWPESWFNSVLGRYVWPSFLGNDATTPDEEVYFVCDDYTNKKYPYFPFPGDNSKQGLGLELEVRFFQFNNPLAEDIIFLVYRVTNKSPRTLNKVYFGMHGDPHIGGPSNYADDRAYFIPPKGPLADPYPQRARSMVYAWDPDMKGDGALTAGYFGFKFLESPSNSIDGKDNDDDGIIDESFTNEAGTFIDGVSLPLTMGIADTVKYKTVFGTIKPRWSGDEDGDWDTKTDDVGLDGLPGTGDTGEGNGKPDVGIGTDGNLTSEPNFGIRDVHESDQIGLTTFYALGYTQSVPNVPKDDVHYWQMLSSDSIDINQDLLNNPGDNVFVYGSGPFRLGPGETQRFSIALLMGNDLPDLLLNSETSQRVLEANYRFAAPPPKPIVKVIPGDKRVTLYWDSNAESAEDPLTHLKDFEGYKIYRSEDPTFSDIYTITDGNGNPYLAPPFTQNGKPAQFDVVNEWSGFHPVEFQGRGIKYNLGGNTGLIHQYVDSSVTNGKRYFYAVVSYDHGSTLYGTEFPPSECPAVVSIDPITNAMSFDVNTAEVVPGPLASGTINAVAGNKSLAQRTAGISTGPVAIQILDPYAVPDKHDYQIDFYKPDSLLAYDLTATTPLTETVTSRDTINVSLSKRDVVSGSVTVTAENGTTIPASNYTIDYDRGVIKGKTSGVIPAGTTMVVTYTYKPVKGSTLIANQDNNPVFDGMKLFALDHPLGIDSITSGWLMGSTNLTVRLQKPVALSQTWTPLQVDFEIRWNATDTLPNGKWAFPGDTMLSNNNRRIAVAPFRIFNTTDGRQFRLFVNGANADSMWRPGREIIILTPVNPIQTYLGIVINKPNGTPIIWPSAGSVYQAKMTKPFAIGDSYSFTTDAVKFSGAKAASMLDKIYVVPNPYVAFSSIEQPGSTSTRRGESKLQFRNLPPACTIRIYTILGELVDTINKDDINSYVDWGMLTYEGQRLAYGVYIYHVDAPGVGEKIGRFAVIK